MTLGTNFYLRKKCLCCGHADEIHIGKASAGWAFAFQRDADNNVTDYHWWWEHIDRRLEAGYVIVDEYNVERTPGYMARVIEAHRPMKHSTGRHITYDPLGHEFHDGDFS